MCKIKLREREGERERGEGESSSLTHVVTSHIDWLLTGHVIPFLSRDVAGQKDILNIENI